MEDGVKILGALLRNLVVLLPLDMKSPQYEVVVLKLVHLVLGQQILVFFSVNLHPLLLQLHLAVQDRVQLPQIRLLELLVGRISPFVGGLEVHTLLCQHTLGEDLPDAVKFFLVLDLLFASLLALTMAASEAPLARSSRLDLHQDHCASFPYGLD